MHWARLAGSRRMPNDDRRDELPSHLVQITCHRSDAFQAMARRCRPAGHVYHEQLGMAPAVTASAPVEKVCKSRRALRLPVAEGPVDEPVKGLLAYRRAAYCRLVKLSLMPRR